MATVYVSLGSNLGDRLKSIKRALTEIEESPRVLVNKLSPVYETQPVGPQNQSWFLNQVIEIQTSLDPGSLLEFLSAIENHMGRKREVESGSRNIDLDILLYEDRIVDTDRLVIPHPRMHQRKFVLIPLSQIAPDVYHPVLGKSARRLLEGCKDDSLVRPYSEKT